MFRQAIAKLVLLSKIRNREKTQTYNAYRNLHRSRKRSEQLRVVSLYPSLKKRTWGSPTTLLLKKKGRGEQVTHNPKKVTGFGYEARIVGRFGYCYGLDIWF